jgi:putative hemolysin
VDVSQTVKRSLLWQAFGLAGLALAIFALVLFFRLSPSSNASPDSDPLTFSTEGQTCDDADVGVGMSNPATYCHDLGHGIDWWRPAMEPVASAFPDGSTCDEWHFRR